MPMNVGIPLPKMTEINEVNELKWIIPVDLLLERFSQFSAQSCDFSSALPYICAVKLTHLNDKAYHEQF